MGSRGPAPKTTPLSRPNDEARKRASFTQISADGQVRGPDLPDGVGWHPMTARWWQTWRVSAQSQTFTPTDWDFLLDTALLHSEYWSGENPGAAGELRIRVAKFGATVEDRLRLRLEAVGPDEDGAKPEQAKPARRQTDARRRRLLKAVKDDSE